MAEAGGHGLGRGRRGRHHERLALPHDDKRLLRGGLGAPDGGHGQAQRRGAIETEPGLIGGIAQGGQTPGLEDTREKRGAAALAVGAAGNHPCRGVTTRLVGEFLGHQVLRLGPLGTRGKGDVLPAKVAREKKTHGGMGLGEVVEPRGGRRVGRGGHGRLPGQTPLRAVVDQNGRDFGTFGFHGEGSG